MVEDLDLKKIKHVHMVGIGGIGMSALADILCSGHMLISGSDLKNNRLIDQLKHKGCRIAKGHKNIYGRPDIVVRSFSVKEDNPEICQARERGIPVVERSELLRSIINSKSNTVAICGTHGKTTTTAMVSLILDKAGLDPTVLIGGEVDHFKGNSKTGKSEVFVTETDESDGFIATLSPRFRVITNLEKDHMEHYKTMNNLMATFKKFIGNSKPGYVMFYHYADGNLRKLKKYFKGRSKSYGFSPRADLCAAALKRDKFSTEFDYCVKGRKLGRVRLNVPGIHNVLNSLAAISVSMELGVPFKKCAELIGHFNGVKRRFEIKARLGGMTLIEDYAHHPTEIRTVIDMARGLNEKRIIAVFQPHRFSRTKHLHGGFVEAFSGVDELVLTDIYAAHEKPIEGVSSDSIRKDIIKLGSVKTVNCISKDNIPGYLAGHVRSGDVVLVIGAGDINGIVPEVIRCIETKI